MKIKIEDYSDGFSITIIDKEKEKRFYFDQEEDHKKLLKVFKEIGIEAVYEEVY